MTNVVTVRWFHAFFVIRFDHAGDHERHPEKHGTGVSTGKHPHYH